MDDDVRNALELAQDLVQIGGWDLKRIIQRWGEESNNSLDKNNAEWLIEKLEALKVALGKEAVYKAVGKMPPYA